SVAAKNAPEKGQWPGCELDGHRRPFVPKAWAFGNHPDVDRTITRTGEDVITLRCPAAATFVWRLIPSRQEPVQATTICLSFPDFRGAGPWIEGDKPDTRAIRRKPNPTRDSWRGQQFP